MILYGLKATYQLANFSGKSVVSSRKLFISSELAEGYKPKFIDSMIKKSKDNFFIECDTVEKCEIVDYEVDLEKQDD